MTAHSGTRRSERGSAVIMALVFTVVVSLVVVSLLGLVQVNLRTTQVVRTHTSQLYAADAGLAHAIEMMRLDRTICPVEGVGGTPLGPIEVNGIEVQLSCRTESGSSSGANGWAIIAHGAPGIYTAIANNDEGAKSVTGPVYAVAFDDYESGGNLEILDGWAREQQGGNGCVDDADAPAGLTVQNPPYNFDCLEGVSVPPDPAHDLPRSIPPEVTDVDGIDISIDDPEDVLDGTCRVFTPGTYRVSPILIDLDPQDPHGNYFESGIYYFENVGVLQIRKQVVIGGQQSSSETSVRRTPSSCDLYEERPAVEGTGVRWILGGTSSMDVATDGTIELFSRADGPAEEGTSGISLQAIGSAEDGWVESEPTSFEERLLDVANGQNTDFAAHGMLYAPGSNIHFFAANDSQAQLRGGAVVETITLGAASRAFGLVVSARTSPEVRTVVVTATAAGVDDAVDVTAEAVVRFSNNEQRSLQIESWRTGRG